MAKKKTTTTKTKVVEEKKEKATTAIVSETVNLRDGYLVFELGGNVEYYYAPNNNVTEEWQEETENKYLFEHTKKVKEYEVRYKYIKDKNKELN